MAGVDLTEAIVIFELGAIATPVKSSLPLRAAKVIPGQIHYRASEVEGKRFGLPELLETSEEPYERVLGEVFSEMFVPGQEISELDGIGGVPLIEIGDALLILSHGEPGRIRCAGHSHRISSGLLTIYRRTRTHRDRAPLPERPGTADRGAGAWPRMFPRRHSSG
jgi:hypothetical protein